MQPARRFGIAHRFLDGDGEGDHSVADLCFKVIDSCDVNTAAFAQLQRGIARDGYRVLDESGAGIGYVTSGSPAPFLKKNIALAYVSPQHAQAGSTVKVEIRGQGVKAQVVPTPFYKRPRKA